ncbi:hypothetical protein GCM10023214_40620 [Amycolatopsis dongchuanensis]|uniref:Uncharacterized protein n=1 Tax=Amycolatopsis dongchuanensis TaxID=1070866 RepID=A0ABP9QT22_9PSEU
MRRVHLYEIRVSSGKHAHLTGGRTCVYPVDAAEVASRENPNPSRRLGRGDSKNEDSTCAWRESGLDPTVRAERENRLSPIAVRWELRVHVDFVARLTDDVVELPEASIHDSILPVPDVRAGVMAR